MATTAARCNEPKNTYGEWQEQPAYREPSWKNNGDADFWNFRGVRTTAAG